MGIDTITYTHDGRIWCAKRDAHVGFGDTKQWALKDLQKSERYSNNLSNGQVRKEREDKLTA